FRWHRRIHKVDLTTTRGDSVSRGKVMNNVKSEILNSWKEIAKYLDRGVRTAQRWERDLHLPVRRPRGKRRSAVLALPKEIDAWLANCPQLALDAGVADGVAENDAKDEGLRGQLVEFSGRSTNSLSPWDAEINISVAR